MSDGSGHGAGSPELYPGADIRIRTSAFSGFRRLYPQVPTLSVARYEVSWRNEVEGGSLFTSPEVTLASTANNITLTTQFPRNRWILLLGGPALGPAILFWGVLIVVTLLGLMFSRIPGLPLTTVDAVLLATGLTLSNLPTTLLVAGWFVVMLVRTDFGRCAVLPRTE